MKFGLGEVLKDKVTGFEGVVLGRTEYFTGCDHYGLCSQELKDGKPIGWEWLDEIRLIKVRGAKKITQELRGEKRTSGPEPIPQM